MPKPLRCGHWHIYWRIIHIKILFCIIHVRVFRWKGLTFEYFFMLHSNWEEQIDKSGLELFSLDSLINFSMWVTRYAWTVNRLLSSALKVKRNPWLTFLNFMTIELWVNDGQYSQFKVAFFSVQGNLVWQFQQQI